MPYQLEPSLNITEISDSKVQISHSIHQITIEEQNDNIIEFVKLVDRSDFPSCLSEHINSDILTEIFNLFLEYHFITEKVNTSFDSLVLDLHLHNKMVDPNYEENTPKSLKGIDLNLVNIFGEGALFERVKSELSNQDMVVKVNPKPAEINNGIMVCCADHPNNSMFSELNALAIDKGMPALFSSLDANKLTVGPFVVPNESSCFSCFNHRMAPNINFIDENRVLQNNKGNLVADKAIPTAYSLFGASHVLSQVLKFQNKAFQLCLIDEVLELNLLDYEMDIRPIVRIPHCNDCYKEVNMEPATAVRALV